MSFKLLLVLPEFGKDVGRYVFLHCPPGKVAVVDELLQIAERVDHFRGESPCVCECECECVCVCVGGGGGYYASLTHMISD